MLCFCQTGIASPESWTYHARRLTGYAESTQLRSFKALKSTPNLESILRTALLTEDRYLAFDVISALQLTALIPDLFKVSLTEESAAAVLTLNTLLNNETRDVLVENYLKQLGGLENGSFSLPAFVAVLDFLGRLRIRLEPDFLIALMESEHYEVRSAALYYVRLIQENQPKIIYPQVYRYGLRDKTSTIRTQAQIALAETNKELPEEDTSLLSKMRYWAKKIWPFRRRFSFVQPKQWVRVPPKTKQSTNQERTACETRYKSFFHSKELNIRIVFGYKDARPTRFVGDRYEAMLLANYLSAECTDGWYACGFIRDKHNPFLWHKLIVSAEGVKKEVNLEVVWSSASPDDDANRLDPFQRVLSAQTRSRFLDGLSHAQVVFYNGHSRDGGGPDFVPPKLTAHKHTDYDWYKKHRLGAKAMLSKIDPKSKLQVLGLFSCSSGKHFREEVHSRKSDLGLISSERLLYYTDALKNELGALSAILGQKCKTDFHEAINSQAEVGESHLHYFY